MSGALLEVRQLSKRFGGLKAVDQLSFSVAEGSIHGLIGPNGAGKTTTFNLISGFLKPTSGSVLLGGTQIGGLQMHRVARLGLVRTFQHSTLFSELTVLENGVVGAHLQYPPKLLSILTGWRRTQGDEAIAQARQALGFFGLLEYANEPAKSLSHGHQRALGMAVALASQPRIVLLDEPFTGMNPEETRRMMDLMFKIRNSGVTILIVEHDMRAIMGICDQITVMNFGKFLAEGRPEEVRRHDQVIEAYLGT
ncbi:MAG: ABC transporter ATP-binding protein, partial [Rhodobacteraceae bacterium]|nr:ABC transporter ATP-binding protein [Paracoccaceae bacterium]